MAFESLADIRRATQAYLDDHVKIKLTLQEVGGGQNLQENDDVTFTIDVTNADNPTGVRLVGISYDVIANGFLFTLPTADLGSVQGLDANGGLTGSPVLTGTLQLSRFRFTPSKDSNGESAEELNVRDHEQFRIKGKVRDNVSGQQSLDVRIHAEVDQEELFAPRTSKATKLSVTVQGD
jgi:hypothetical protein